MLARFPTGHDSTGRTKRKHGELTGKSELNLKKPKNTQIHRVVSDLSSMLLAAAGKDAQRSRTLVPPQCGLLSNLRSVAASPFIPALWLVTGLRPFVGNSGGFTVE